MEFLYKFKDAHDGTSSMKYLENLGLVCGKDKKVDYI